MISRPLCRTLRRCAAAPSVRKSIAFPKVSINLCSSRKNDLTVRRVSPASSRSCARAFHVSVRRNMIPDMPEISREETMKGVEQLRNMAKAQGGTMGIGTPDAKEEPKEPFERTTLASVGGASITCLGTRQNTEDYKAVAQEVKRLRPDIVCLELNLVQALHCLKLSDEKHREAPLGEVGEIGEMGVLKDCEPAVLEELETYFLKHVDIVSCLEQLPAKELMMVVNACQQMNVPLWLIDRHEIASSTREDLDEFLGAEDVQQAQMDLAVKDPRFVKALEERDTFMTAMLRYRLLKRVAPPRAMSEKSVVVVLGESHIPGIKTQWEAFEDTTMHENLEQAMLMCKLPETDTKLDQNALRGLLVARCEVGGNWRNYARMWSMFRSSFSAEETLYAFAQMVDTAAAGQQWQDLLADKHAASLKKAVSDIPMSSRVSIIPQSLYSGVLRAEQAWDHMISMSKHRPEYND